VCANLQSELNQPQSIDWSGIRAASLVIGVREAARRAAANLPADEVKRFVSRVLKRCDRERWLDILKEPSKQNAAGPLALPQSSNVFNGSDSLAAHLREDNESTRADLSRATRKASKVLGDADGEFVIARSEDLRRVVSSAAQIHGWDQEQQGSGTFGGLRVHSQQTIINVDQRKSISAESTESDVIESP
jgi:hypothetical protein